MKRFIGVVALGALTFLAVRCQDSPDLGSPQQPELDRREGLLSQKRLPEGVDPSEIIMVPDAGPNQPLGSPLRGAAGHFEMDIGAGLNQSDDDCDNVALPFTFPFWATDFTDVWVNSNGNVTFDSCNTDWWHPDIPDTPDRPIAGPLYGDFNPGAGGDVHTNTVGTAPNRRFVVTWNAVPEFADGAGTNTFQMQLFEATDQIQFGYNGLTTDGINWSFAPPATDAQMDVGIATNPFIRSARGSEIPGLDGGAICYTPDGAGGYVETMGPCGAAGPAPATCNGKTATMGVAKFTFLNTVFWLGTSGADVIIGDGKRDVVVAREGSDDICTNGGQDAVQAGPGDDHVELGSGSDAAFGDSGEDEIFGEEGNDHGDCGHTGDPNSPDVDTDSFDGGPGTDTGVLCEVETNVEE